LLKVAVVVVSSHIQTMVVQVVPAVAVDSVVAQQHPVKEMLAVTMALVVAAVVVVKVQ
jgi:hypothetical protein